MGDPHNNKGGYEVKYTDPAGVIFDIAEEGWAGAQKIPGEADNITHPNTRARVPRFDERRFFAKLSAGSGGIDVAARTQWRPPVIEWAERHSAFAIQGPWPEIA